MRPASMRRCQGDTKYIFLERLIYTYIYICTNIYIYIYVCIKRLIYATSTPGIWHNCRTQNISVSRCQIIYIHQELEYIWTIYIPVNQISSKHFAVSDYIYIVYVICIHNIDQSHRYPRDWRHLATGGAAIEGPNWNPSDQNNTIVLRGLRGALTGPYDSQC